MNEGGGAQRPRDAAARSCIAVRPLCPPDLRDPACYPHPAGPVELIETHISWVFLAGEYAYKIKKPVRLPFLDFSTLAARRHYCEEELRLNRRTAPELYLTVLPVSGSLATPRIGGAGEAIEYVLKMRRFSRETLAERVAQRGQLSASKVDALAALIAAFHAAIAAAPPVSGYGAPGAIARCALANFEPPGEPHPDAGNSKRLRRLRTWTQAECGRLAGIFARRKHDGFVRECHGDLHLGNIVFPGGRPLLFDCLEFSAELRWIDVMSEVAFLAMDLLRHALEAEASRLINAYLEATGDYAGLAVLRFYLVYRALVRAKIARIRAAQPGIAAPARGAALADRGRYIALAESLAVPARAALVLMHGLAGSGKTTVAQALVEGAGAIRVRADVERKRLHGLPARARTRAGPYAGIYAREASRITYDRLKRIVRDIVASGHAAIVDAAFLWRAERDAFRALARELEVPFMIVSCRASHAELRRRVAKREAAMNDASEADVAVLENQIATEEPLGQEELASAALINTGVSEAALRGAAAGIARRLRKTQTAHAPRSMSPRASKHTE